MNETTLLIELFKVAGPVTTIALSVVWVLYKIISKLQVQLGNHLAHIETHFKKVEDKLDKLISVSEDILRGD